MFSMVSKIVKSSVNRTKKCIGRKARRRISSGDEMPQPTRVEIWHHQKKLFGIQGNENS